MGLCNAGSDVYPGHLTITAKKRKGETMNALRDAIRAIRAKGLKDVEAETVAKRYFLAENGNGKIAAIQRAAAMLGEQYEKDADSTIRSIIRGILDAIGNPGATPKQIGEVVMQTRMFGRSYVADLVRNGLPDKVIDERPYLRAAV